MAGATLKVHLVSEMAFKPLEELVGFLAEDAVAMVGPGEDGQPQKLYGLAMNDPDGEAHIYVFSDAGKQRLIGKLTGGLVIPTG